MANASSRRWSRLSTLVFCTLAVTACKEDLPTSSDAGDNVVSGQYRGFSLRPADAGFVLQTARDGAEVMVILLGDFNDVCGELARGAINLGLFEIYQNVPNSRLLSWAVIGQDPSGGPGTIDPGPIAFAVPCFDEDCPGLPPPPLNRDWGFPLLSSADGRCKYGSTLVDFRSPTLRVSLELTGIFRDPGGYVVGTFAPIQLLMDARKGRVFQASARQLHLRRSWPARAPGYRVGAGR